MLSLGVSCKKEIVKEEVKVENQAKKADGPGVPVQINPEDYNPLVYPHSTGFCYCGQGPKCNPKPHRTGCRFGQVDNQGNQYGCSCW